MSGDSLVSPQRGFIVPPMKRVEIRLIAKSIREIAGIIEDRFPIIEFLEFVLPQIDSGFWYDICEHREMGNIHGLAIPHLKLIKIREDVYERAKRDCGRDRSTIAHEVGHYILHPNPAYARYPASEKIPRHMTTEWQADAFAGELLIPAHHLRGDETPEELMKRFCVSEASAHYQWRAFKRDRIIK